MWVSVYYLVNKIIGCSVVDIEVNVVIECDEFQLLCGIIVQVVDGRWSGYCFGNGLWRRCYVGCFGCFFFNGILLVGV